MNTFKYIFAALILFFTACSSDNDTIEQDRELDGLELIKVMKNATHDIEVYSESGTLEVGYNAISIRIKNQATGQYVQNASMSWTPVMQMASLQHSCPYSEINKTAGRATLYSGYIIFQMPQNATEYWTLSVNYTIDGAGYSVGDSIDVQASAKRRLAAFTGSDGNSYIVALVTPTDPQVALNEMTAAVFKTESMMSYSEVSGFTVKIDPRMPSMGNHGSPNNQDLIQGADGLYHGILSLTMTGYWKINLQVLNSDNVLLKGEPVTAANPESSIFFEVEF